MVSSINEPDDEKVEILFGWYTGPGLAHSSNTLRKTSTKTHVEAEVALTTRHWATAARMSIVLTKT
jgi:hypothetical protein